MKKISKILLFLAFAVFLIAGNSFSLDFGDNITIYDNRGYTGSGVGGEDQETEPGMINNQDWDLEGFFLYNTTLTMVGGFDFIKGVDGYPLYTSGDIFIDVDGNAQFGDGQDLSILNYGYDYVLDLDLNPESSDYLTYDVYELSESSTLTPVLEWYNDPESNPWLYAGGDSIFEDSSGTKWEDMTISLYNSSDTTDFPVLGFYGGTHYALSVNLAFLGADIGNFTSHFTMGCGNDNLMGKNSVPEPTPMLLLGTGLIGLAGIGRRRFFK